VCKVVHSPLVQQSLVKVGCPTTLFKEILAFI